MNIIWKPRIDVDQSYDEWKKCRSRKKKKENGKSARPDIIVRRRRVPIHHWRTNRGGEREKWKHHHEIIFTRAGWRQSHSSPMVEEYQPDSMLLKTSWMPNHRLPNDYRRNSISIVRVLNQKISFSIYRLTNGRKKQTLPGQGTVAWHSSME